MSDRLIFYSAIILFILVFNLYGVNLFPSSKGAVSSEVMLYFCPLNINEITPDQAEFIEPWLTEDELIKVSRYIQATDRDKGLMVRGYLSGILSLYSAIDLNIKPQDWRFKYAEKGKPTLTAEFNASTGIKFNISHSGDWLVVALITCDQASIVDDFDIELGVDIERSRESTNIYPILSHYFTQIEADELLALPESCQRARFFDLWALKESYIKAKGLGLALSLKSFSFDFSEMIQSTALLKKSGEKAKKFCVLEHIGLNFHHSDMSIHEAKNWWTYLAKLDDKYRFALSLSNVANVTLDTEILTFKTMLARLSIK